jgi:hypothetical protein
MTDDADKGGEWVTGFTGESFQLDKDGNPIPNAPSEPPTELPSAADIWDAADKTAPGGSQEIGGADDETQKDIWQEMDRGDSGPGAGATPEDAETTI